MAANPTTKKEKNALKITIKVNNMTIAEIFNVPSLTTVDTAGMLLYFVLSATLLHLITWHCTQVHGFARHREAPQHHFADRRVLRCIFARRFSNFRVTVSHVFKLRS
jgi:hypothetical protein